MKMPKLLPVTVTDSDIDTSVENLINLGKSTPACCLGAVACQRTLENLLQSKSALNLRYSQDMVTALRGSNSTAYYRKNREAKDVDRDFDDIFEATINKFGHPDGWQNVRRAVRNFMRRRLAHLANTPILLTRYARKKKGEGESHTVNKTTGQVDGGHTKPRTCKTRVKRINDVIDKYAHQ